jgi:P-type Ca2+ transporter type 2C
MPSTLRSSKKPPRGPSSGSKLSSSSSNSSSSSPSFDASLHETLKRINQAQAIEQNLAHLQTLGGVAAVAALLRTDPERGIEIDTIDARRATFGPNELPVTPRKSFWELFLGTFEDATLQILIVSAVVSLAIGLYDDPATGYVEGVAILAAVLVVSVVTAANDYQKESQFRELSAVNNEKDVVVIRGGIHWQIPIQQIVVGDIVCMESGDQVPCDGVLTLANAVEVDESALTGEAVDVYKDVDTDPFMLSGCVLEAGSCQFLAIAVGKQSQWGIIQSHLDVEQEQTPLQQKLDDMAANIGYVGMAAAGATFCAMMFIKIVLDPVYVRDISIFAYALEAFIIGVTIVVVAVPEGLPLAVTISLAFSTKKMLADQNLIRHLAACETMGNATNILSDKTGTLTENRMTVVKGVFADTVCEDTVHRVPMLVSTKAFHYLLEGIACCSTARVTYEEVVDDDDASLSLADPSPAARASPASLHVRRPSSDLHIVRRPSWDEPRRPSFSDHPAAGPSKPRGRPHIIGNKTEASLLILAQSAWSHYDHAEERREEARFGKPGGSRLFPFSSKRKRMSVLVTKPDLSGANEWTLYHKGAAEVVLAACSFYLDIDGSEKTMTKEKRAEFASIIAQFASEALRCVALAHRSNIQELVKPLTCTADDVEKKLEKDMCLDAIAGIMDPLREDVVEAVATCQRAGIIVRMVTGDNIDTARAIARKAGILTDGAFQERTC